MRWQDDGKELRTDLELGLPAGACWRSHKQKKWKGRHTGGSNRPYGTLLHRHRGTMKPPEGVWRHSLSFLLGALCTLALVLLGAGPRWQGGGALEQKGITRSGAFTSYFQFKCCARWRPAAVPAPSPLPLPACVCV